MKVITAMAAFVLALVLAGCGDESPVPGGTTSLSSPDPTPTVTGPCPTVDDQPVPEGCAPYDPDAAMRANDAYRQRGELPPDMREEALAHRDQIAEALSEAVAAGPLTADGAKAALEPLGYESVQSYGSSEVGGGLAIGVSTGSGCVYGDVHGTEVSLEVGGGIADGGCLPAEGH